MPKLTMPSNAPSEKDVEAGFNFSKKIFVTKPNYDFLVPNKIQKTFGNRFAVSATEAEISRKSSAASELSLPISPKTLEHPPIIDFYQQTQQKNAENSEKRRPTLTELIHGSQKATGDESLEDFEKRNAKIIQVQLKAPKNRGTKIHPSEVENGTDKRVEKNKTETKKFGWIEGVFIRCCANIFGVMLYVRMAWVAGQAGIIMGSLIVLLGALITLITALSMSAICTNGLVKGGGAYYLVRKLLKDKGVKNAMAL
uniref:Amino acid permease/ SLC12A domain-containing protein n=1 Tax=Panagrolaimus davidi TaxID=227884 RepID=A0A914P7T8_9BILA